MMEIASNRGPSYGRLVAILCGGLVALAASAPARAQDDCSDTITQAEVDFAAGVLPLDYAALARCADAADHAADAVRAYRLSALAHHGEGAEAEAKLALMRLHWLAPSYEPDRAFDPPDYVALVADVKRELELPSLYRCDRELFEAQRHYSLGSYEDAIRVLVRCTVHDDLLPAEAGAAFRLLAMSYHSRGAEADAKLALVRLLELAPSYEPDRAFDPLDYVALVTDVKHELQLFSSSPCYRELSEAEVHYVKEAYGEAVDVLRGCLARPELPPAEAVRAYRLTTLAHLKMGALAAARESAAALLRVAPDYEADPVQDLPPYVALLNIIRAQIADGTLP